MVTQCQTPHDMDLATTSATIQIPKMSGKTLNGSFVRNGGKSTIGISKNLFKMVETCVNQPEESDTLWIAWNTLTTFLRIHN